MPKMKIGGGEMVRPSKSIAVSSGKISKKEKKQRLDKEKLLKGSDDNIKPLRHLNKRQKRIFKNIVDELRRTNILGNLDVYLLNQTAISIERLETLEKQANENSDLLLNGSYKSIHDMYSKDFFRCCNELCLSPQSRAKLSISATTQEEKKKTLTELLSDEDDE